MAIGSKRRRPLDAVLIFGVLPIWTLWFGFQCYWGLGRHDAWLPVYVAAAPDPTRQPIVTSISPLWRTDLRIGDRLLRFGDTDLAGVGPFTILAAALEAASPDRRLEATVERGTETLRVPLDLDYSVLLDAFVARSADREDLTSTRVAALVAAFLATMLFALTVIRKPGWPVAQSLFLGSVCVQFGQGFLGTGPRPQTYVLLLLRVVGMAWGGAFGLSALASIPDRTPPPRWPWLFVPAMAIMATSAIFGVPFQEVTWSILVPVISVAVLLTGLVVLTRNYVRSDAAGRRQVKWLLYAIYLFQLPPLLMLLVRLSPATAWLYAPLSRILPFTWLLTPACVWVAISFHNLFDVDRLIGATLSYSVVAMIFLAALFAVVPALATAMAPWLRLEPVVAQSALSVVFAAGVVSAQRWVRPVIDRLFFAERYALERGVDDVLDALPRATSVDELLASVASTLADAVRPETCLLYVRSGDDYVPAFQRGGAAASIFPANGPLVAALQAAGGVLAEDRRVRGHVSTASSPFERAVLEMLGARVVVPIRRARELTAFLSLGRKRSDDVYTPTDTRLLTRMAREVGNELLRFDAGEQPLAAADRSSSAAGDASYDVFISYRRQGGAAEARAIHAALSARGVSSFLDVDELRAGVFEPALARVIVRAPFFVVVLTPGSLDRCGDDGDWLRREIAEAATAGRTIIPVVTPGFAFPAAATLPPELRVLPGLQAVSYTHEYFDAMIDKLLAYVREERNRRTGAPGR